MTEPQKILVAVAWPYANGPRHIGHVAGFGVPSDIFARYHRLRGNDVLMVSGTDEHGTPIMVAADREGISPRELADTNSAVIRNDLLRLGLSYDLFTRTTTENHHRVVRDVFRTLWDKGFIIERTTVGAFSATTAQTLPDRYVEGTCPICGFKDARGDQCDNCGNQLDPADLVEPRSKIDGQPPVFRETTHLFLDLPAFKDELTGWIEARAWTTGDGPRAVFADSVDWLRSEDGHGGSIGASAVIGRSVMNLKTRRSLVAASASWRSSSTTRLRGMPPASRKSTVGAQSCSISERRCED